MSRSEKRIVGTVLVLLSLILAACGSAPNNTSSAGGTAAAGAPAASSAPAQNSQGAGAAATAANAQTTQSSGASGGATSTAALPAQSSNGQPVTLKVWDQFTGDGSKAVDQIYKMFMAKYPNITIKREAIQTDQMRQTVKTALGSGTGPDVIYYDAGPGYAGVLAQAGLLQPLEKYSTQYNWKQTIAPAALRGTTINGQIYGVPLEVDLIGLYYNKTLIDKAGLKLPTNTTELMSFCKQAADKGYIPMAFGDNPGWQGFHQFSMTSNNMVGPEYMQSLLFDNKGSWNTPEMVKAIKTYFVDLRQAGCFPKNVNALKNDDVSALFNGGKALMYPTGSWMSGGIADVAAKKKWDMEMTSFPALPGGKGSFFLTGVGSAWFISKQSPNADAAATFINYLISPDAAKLWVEQNSSFLPVKLDTSKLQVAPLVKKILDVLQASIEGKTTLGQNIDVLAPPQFNTEMQNGFQAVLADKKTPEQEAADLQKAWAAGAK